MNIQPYVEEIHDQLLLAAEAAGDDAREVAARLVAPLDSAIRLALQDVLSSAAEEITTELAPGRVELRLRGRDPEFVVTPPPSGAPVEETVAAPVSVEREDGEMARINLRMPDHLKARVEDAANKEAQSVNSWLVRAAATALERADHDVRRERRAPQGSQRYTGWVR